MANMMDKIDLNGWLPIRAWLHEGDWWLDWCWFGTQRLTRPFLRNDVDAALRLPFNQAFRHQTRLQTLLQWHSDSPGLSPNVLVFHASRCGSTLIAQLLAGLERNIVLSEPPPLDSLLRAHLCDPGASRWQVDAVAALLSAYGQRRRGDERQLVVKLDAWNVFEAPMLASLYPETPRLFLYRDPIEIVVSQLQLGGMQRLAGLLGPSALDALIPNAQAMPVLEYCCRMVGEILRAGLALCRDLGAIAVNYSELPQAMWGRLGPVLGIEESDRRQLQAIALQAAKHPNMPFAQDTQRKREAATDAVHEAVQRWAWAPYAALERLRLGGEESAATGSKRLFE